LNPIYPICPLKKALGRRWGHFCEKITKGHFHKRGHLDQKIFEFHAGVKKCHFGNFSECPVSAALKNPSVDMKNSFGIRC